MHTPTSPTAPLAALAQDLPSGGRLKIAAAAWMVTAVFILSNSATPLYVHWQRQFAFSSATLTVIFAAYIAGLLGALLVAGQLSDRLGRKAVLVPGFLIAMAACGLFIIASSVAALVAARFLTGIAVGVIVSAGMATVVDVGGQARKRQASLAASVAMVLGAGMGPLLSGMLAHGMPHPVWAIFGIEFALLFSALAVIVAMPIPRPSRKCGDIPAGHLRLPSVPAQNRIDLALGVAVFAPGISATSFVLSLGPALLSNLLHVGSPLVAGSIACIMFMSATGVQFAVRKLPIRTVFLLSTAATALSMSAMILAVHAAQPALLLAAAILAGMGQGQGQLGGLTLIGLNVGDQQRAQANSLLNIGGYIPAGLLPVATGFLIDRAGLATGTIGFALLLIAASAAAAGFVATRLPRSSNAVSIVEAFWTAVWQGKDFDAIDRFCVEDVVITSGGVDIVSRASFKAWAKQFNDRIGDLQFEVIESFQNEEGSRVASRWRVSGRNKGIFGLPPDQRELSFTGTAVWQVREDGKLMHNWVERASWEAYSALVKR